MLSEDSASAMSARQVSITSSKRAMRFSSGKGGLPREEGGEGWFFDLFDPQQVPLLVERCMKLSMSLCRKHNDNLIGVNSLVGSNSGWSARMIPLREVF